VIFCSGAIPAVAAASADARAFPAPAGSLMLANGYPVTTVAAILRHTPAVLMKTYAHAIPKRVIQAPRNIADVLPYVPADRPAKGPAVLSAVPSHLRASLPTPAKPLALQLTLR
jgi:hypothetical protein